MVRVPSSVGIGSLKLDDGGVKGFICEGHAIEGAEKSQPGGFGGLSGGHPR